MKECPHCKTSKANSDFNKSSLSRDGLASYCKVCQSTYNKERNKKRWNEVPKLSDTRGFGKYGSSKDPNYKKIYQLDYSHGITLSDYNNLFVKQKGCCAICGKHQTILNKTLNVDHCHKTGKIRGLLCTNCNHGLGKFYDNAEVLKVAINYLNNSTNA